ncbi:MAG: endopeptidase La, partial [Planctomycetes bacterium]|nr:endopeptidase La [Planctomycetota bacterium]
TYLDWMTELPWAAVTEDNLDIYSAERILNADHYGLEKVKKRILEYLAVRKLAPQTHGPILCFVGPPGVGKTSLGQSIARALGRKFIRMSLGGVRDEAELRGHRRTYIGAMPGRIVQELRKTGSINPVFMLDELDKVGQDFRGDPTSVLLEVLDPAQNNTFQDHYLNVPLDLSRILFIGTANYMGPVPPALRDRMEIIELPGYTAREKLQIARRYLLPRQLKENGLNRSQLTLSSSAMETVINKYTQEAGVRELERQIGAICRHMAALVARGSARKRTVHDTGVAKYLGPVLYESEVAQRTSTPGVATGLFYTPSGGGVLFVEATRFPGEGRLTLTGQIGDIMKESAQAALSLVRSRAGELKIDPEQLSKTDIHIHVPAGAVPKDGPSAGVAMVTALTSLLLDKSVHPDVAMTGEITLRGLVLPVGGLKQKILAAKTAGIRTVILPRRNRKDMVDLPPDVRKGLEFVFVGRIEEALKMAMNDKPSMRQKTKTQQSRATQYASRK